MVQARRSQDIPSKAPASPVEASGTVKTGSMPPPVELPYKTAPSPYMTRESDKVRAEILNQQPCGCGHDRLSHGHHVGKGKERHTILDCPHAGRCLVRGCECSHFRFDSYQAGPIGKTKRARELKEFKIVPPEMDHAAQS